MLNLTVAYAALGAAICALIGAVVSGARGGNPVTGFVLGLLLGPVGILFSVLLGPPIDRPDGRAD